MRIPSTRTLILPLLAGLALSACAEPAATVAAAAVPVQAARPAQSPAVGTLPLVEVFKSPSCGCCTGWVDHLRAAGFQVDVTETDDLEPVRKQLGVPYGKGSCHTAKVGGYVVEGHVPAADIQRLLAERPDVRGLVLPGMPLGSPGMEVPDGRVQRYTVEQVARDGSTSAWATHGPR